VCGEPTLLVAALTAKAQADLAVGDASAAHAALDEAEEVAASEAVLARDRRELTATRARISPRPNDLDEADYGPFVETLTDREHAILMSLPGHLSQREIGVELSITLNTVKGYTKSLYRKLGVTSREGAVFRGRSLGLI
jgi:LuxR family maltose regulon positive regulatory protein